MMDESRWAVVTGASSGIGLACTKLLLDEQWQVCGLARRAASVFADNSAYHPHDVDLAQLNTLPSILKNVTATLPRLDALILCAGKGRFGGLEEFSFAQIEQLIALNLTSQLFCVRALLPVMQGSGGGVVILIGSESALHGGTKGAVYSATKFALRGFAQSLRQDVVRHGVRVSVINPGMVRTPFFNDLNFAPGEGDEHALDAETISRAVAHILTMPKNVVIDEVNLSPLKKVVAAKKKADED